MLRILLKYSLALFILFQSWHGVMAAPAENVMCDTAMYSMAMQDGAPHECKHAQHKQLCVQACAMLHDLLPESVYPFDPVVTVHTSAVLLLLTGISHRPLVPPPIRSI